MLIFCKLIIFYGLTKSFTTAPFQMSYFLAHHTHYKPFMRQMSHFWAHLARCTSYV